MALPGSVPLCRVAAVVGEAGTAVTAIVSRRQQCHPGRIHGAPSCLLLLCSPRGGHPCDISAGQRPLGPPVAAECAARRRVLVPLPLPLVLARGVGRFSGNCSKITAPSLMKGLSSGGEAGRSGRPAARRMQPVFKPGGGGSCPCAASPSATEGSGLPGDKRSPRGRTGEAGRDR